MSDDRRWIWVSLPRYTVLIGVRNGRVSTAPPVMAWSVGQPERSVARYLIREGATIVPLDTGDRAIG